MKKNPVVASILAFLVGPLGYFYFGWRSGLAFVLTGILYVALFLFTVSIVDDMPTWVHWVNHVVSYFARNTLSGSYGT